MTKTKRSASGPRTEDSLLFLTESQRVVFDRVMKCIETLRLASADAADGNVTRASATESGLKSPALNVLRDRNVISILGGRGSGKTTVLLMVLQALKSQSPRTIVLRPIYPESFLVGDDPIGWISTALLDPVQKAVEELRNRKRPNDADQLREAYDQFSHRVTTYLLARRERGFDSSADTMVRKGDLLAAAGESGSSLMRKLEALLVLLFEFGRNVSSAKRVDSSLAPALVVSFDDVDLYPDRVTRILQVLPSLSLLPQTIVIIAADPSLIKAQLSRDCSAFMTEDLAQTGRQLAEDQFMKRMPWDLRFELRNLTTAERWTFRPLVQRESIVDVLRQIRLRRTGYGPQTLADFFDLSWNYGDSGKDRDLRPTLYTRILPPDPRSLVNLHGILLQHRGILQELVRRDPAVFQSDEYQMAFRSFFADFVEFTSHRYTIYSDVVQRVFDFETYPDSIGLDPSKLHAGLATSESTLYSGLDSAVIIRSFWVKYMDRTLPQPVAGLLSFSEELNFCPVRVGYVDHMARPGGITSKDKVFGSRDGRFGWPRPRFDSYLTHEAFNLRWDTAVRWFRGSAAAKLFRNSHGPSASYLLFFYWYVSALIESVCVGGEAVPLQIYKQDLARDSVWQPLANRLAHVMVGLETMSPADDFATNVRADFKIWVSRDLAWLCTEEAARGAEVAERAKWLRLTISAAVPDLEKDLEQGQRDADECRAQLDQVWPVVSFDNIDIERLIRDVVARKDEALTQAMIALQRDRRPSSKREALADIMKQLGYKVPEAESGLKTGEPIRA